MISNVKEYQSLVNVKTHRKIMNQSDTQRTDSGNESVFDSFRVSLEKRILNYNYKQ